MKVPEFGVLRYDGVLIPLYSLVPESPVALVFLRHLGCIFCRQQVGILRDSLPGENIVFVTMSDPKVTARFRTWMKSPHTFLCDPERRLYEAFKIPRSTAGRYFTASVVREALKAYRKGYRNALNFDDQLQLGGTYVFDQEGNVLASFIAEDISDTPSPETLRELLHSPGSVYEATPS